MNKTFYITTPIYYVNAKPHIGHAYTSIAADVVARYHRMNGKDVLFLTGTDEHGQKILQAANENGVTPKEFVDSIVPFFKDLWKTLDVQYDDFIRTTDERHKKSVRKLLTKLHDQGDLYLGEYSGWYCTPCERFCTDSQIEEGKVCPDCGRELEEIVEKNYFFKMSKYQQWLIDYIKENDSFVLPVTRRNEVLGLLENHLEDLCISRPKFRLAWGIELPFSPEHVTYVWFDALTNYISAIDYLNEGDNFKKYWPADYHLIGKDIIRHHAVFWPIMLKALGLELPKTVFAHGWWMQDGSKMSKSRGKVVDPQSVIDDYGLDAFRYFLLREVPFGHDGTFSDEAFITRYNSDLANDVGNLLNRSLTMVEKYFEGKVPEYGEKEELDAMLFDRFATLHSEISSAMEKLEFHHALTVVWELINRANKYIEEAKPWTLKKEENITRLGTVIYNLVESLRVIALYIWPFMPQTSEKIWSQLGLEGTPSDVNLSVPQKWGGMPSGILVNKQAPLFPRIETKE